jgi:hypothetical protein
MSNMQQDQAPAARPAGGVYKVRLTKVSSFVVFTNRQVTTYTGTLEQLEAAARGVQTHNLALGWWGIPAGVVWTPMALSRNAKAMRQVRELAGRG